MKPGRELDALVAERVMDHILGKMSDQDAEWSIIIDQATARFDVMPNYSTDISAAWEVVEKMKNCGFTIEQCGDGSWFAGFLEPADVMARGETAPEAICLAALKAVDYAKKN